MKMVSRRDFLDLLKFPTYQLSIFTFCINFMTGWGPCELPDTFKDMPYQPFSKSDRLGKISDWTGSAQTDKKYNNNKYQSQFGSGSQYAYYHDEDETTFHLVDNARVQKPPHQRGRFRGNNRNNR
jgi:translation initiation factor 3 subunit D